MATQTGEYQSTLSTQYTLLDTDHSKPSKPLPNADWVCTMFRSVSSETEYLLEVGILILPVICVNCSVDYGLETPVSWKDPMKMNSYRCTVGGRTTKRHNYSLYENTIFFKSRVDINIAMKIAYFWLVGWKNKITHTNIQTLIGSVDVSTKTISKYIQLFTKLCAFKYLHMKKKIGGPKYIVQIDETLVFKRKSGKGRKLSREATYFLGGIELSK